MAQHHLYSQDLDASIGVTDSRPDGASLNPETVPFYGAGSQSSTRLMSNNGSYIVDADYVRDQYANQNEDEYNDHIEGIEVNEDEEDTEDTSREPSNTGSMRPLIFKPVPPPSGYTPLTFRPTMLTRWILLAIALLYLAILGLLSCLVYRSYSAQVWTIRNVNFYLAARYLPSVMGVCTNILFSSTISTLRRILPFIHLADQKNSTNKYRMKQTVCARYFPLASWKYDRVMRFFFLTSWIVNFMLPAKATLFKVDYTGSGVWNLSVRLVPAVFLSLAYLLLASTNIFIAVQYAGRSTGLKKDWDPTSLADMILLFTPTDTLPELDHGLKEVSWYRMINISEARYRLGYWEITNLGESKHPVIYGIREIEAVGSKSSDRHLRLFNNYIKQRGSLSSYCRHLDDLATVPNWSSSENAPAQSHLLLSCCQERPQCRHYPYRRVPFSDKDLCFLKMFLLVAMVVCLAYGLVRIWCFQGVIFQSGSWTIQSNDIVLTANGTEFVSPEADVPFHPISILKQDDAAMRRDILAFMLLRFLPVLAVSMAGASITLLDVQHRWVQPFTNMYQKPSLASDSLLLDYMTVSPLEVLPQAWANGHFRVVYYGVLSALNWIPPLIVTGLCAIIETGSGVIVQLSPTAACLTITWSILYIHSLISTTWPSAERRLPRDVGSLYDILCFFYDSHLRWFPEFGHAAFSSSVTKDEVHSLLRLARDKFCFGLVGDAQEGVHTGFDVAGHVTLVTPIPGICHRMRNTLLGRKDKTRPSMHGSNPNFEHETIPLDRVNASHSANFRGSSITEKFQPTGRSTAVY